MFWAIPWGDESLLLMPPMGDCHRLVEKVRWEGDRGIAVVPVLKGQTWFWSLGEVAIDLSDFPASQKILVVEWAKTHRQSPLKFRPVIFDSLGEHQDGLHKRGWTSAHTDKKKKTRRHWQQPQARRPVVMSRTKWCATVLQQAKDRFLPLPPEPPGSEFSENSVRVSAMNFSFPDPVVDPASVLRSTPIPADGDSMIGAVQELLREVQTPDHQVKLSPPPSEHELKKVQHDSVNRRSFTAEETSQRICHWDAQVNTMKLHSELNDKQFCKFLHFSQTVAEPTPNVFPARNRCVQAVIEANFVMPGSERYRHWV